MKSLSQLDEAQSKITAARKEIEETQKNTLKVIKDALKDLASIEGIEGFRWRQWRPGFNDGDPCEFTLDDLEVRLSQDLHEIIGDAEENDNGDKDEGWIYAHDVETKDIIAHERLKEHLAGTGIEPEQVVTSIKKIAHVLFDLEELLEQEWGENIQITVTKKGITTEDYDPGY